MGRARHIEANARECVCSAELSVSPNGMKGDECSWSTVPIDLSLCQTRLHGVAEGQTPGVFQGL